MQRKLIRETKTLGIWFRKKYFSVLCLVLMNLTLYAQNLTVSGVVTDANTNETLPGVNIVVKGTQTGVATDMDGNYSIAVNSPDDVLTFSSVGYIAEEQPINGRSVINITLVPDIEAIDEVVVIGYGTVKRKDLTGSIATMSGEDLEKIPIANAAEAIKGRLPGVNVLTMDGSPDADVVIRVRGGGSVTQDNSPLLVVDGFIVGTIRNIPPTDITSISVLKDAAATAIYGAQAANGVILITTRRPTAGKTSVSYNGFMQWKHLPAERKYEVLSPYEFVLAQYEYAKLRSDADVRNFEKYFGKYQDIELYKDKRPTDWQDELFGDPKLSQLHSLSISGGSEATKLSLSVTNNNDEGILVGSGYYRTAINFKLQHDITRSLQFEASTRIANTVVDGAGTSGSSQLRVKDAITTRPVNGIADELDIDLSTVDTEDDYQSFLLSLINPLELAEQDWRKRTTKTYVLNTALNWNILPNLLYRTTFTTSTKFDEQLRYYGPLTSRSQQDGSSLPMGTMGEDQDYSYRWLNTLNYNFLNLGKHQLDFLLGQEIYSSGGKSNDATSILFRESMQPEEMFANMALGTNVAHSTYEKTEQNRSSFFGRANYQFNNKYLVTATIRTDASSKFSKDNRLGIFPAVALGWKLSEEDFLKNLEFINELKLRASYGETGNDRIPANSTKFLFRASTSNGPGMGTNDYNSYYRPDGSTLYNPNIVWETTINRNAGLDFTLYKARLNGTFDLYWNTTKDLLLASAISPISGFTTQWNNIGSTSNRGIELAINAYIIEKNDFSLSVNANFGINKSRIEELDETDERFYQSNWSSTDLKDRDDYYLKVGSTIGLIYGYVTDGMYTVDDFSSYDTITGQYTLKGPEDGVYDDRNTLGVSNLRPGYLKLKDLNNDSLINSQDRQVIGSTLPEAVGGFGLDVRYKGFDASLFFNFSIGNDVYNTGKIIYNQYYRTTFGSMLDNMRTDNRYTYIDIDGSITGTPGEVVTDFEQLRQMNQGKEMWSMNGFGQATTVIHSWAVEDGSFLRLNTATIGYTLPSNITSKIKMKQFRIYVTGYNLWLWTKYSGYDPEVSTTRSSDYQRLTPGMDYSAYPRSRSITFGVNISF